MICLWCETEFNSILDGAPSIIKGKDHYLCRLCAAKLDAAMLANGVKGGIIGLDSKFSIPDRMVVELPKQDEEPLD